MTSSPSTIDAKVRARLSDGSLAGTWRLNGATSTVRLRSKSVWGLVPVKGTFGQVSGEGVISPAGVISGSIRVASASIDTKNKKPRRTSTVGGVFQLRRLPRHHLYGRPRGRDGGGRLRGWLPGRR